MPMFNFYTHKTELNGTVKNVIQESCIVEIEERKSQGSRHKIVHFELYLCHNTNIHLPKIGDHLSISDYYKHKFTKPRNCFVKQDATVINYNKDKGQHEVWNRNNYVKMIMANKLNVEKVITFKTFYPQVVFKNNSTFMIKLRILDYMHLLRQAKRSKLEIPVIKTIRDCTYASNNTVLKNGPDLMHGVYCSKSGEYLIGLLIVDIYGSLRVESGQMLMIAKITTDDNFRLKSSINQIIIINKFICITENYKNSNRVVPFLLFDVNNIQELELENVVKENSFIFDIVPEAAVAFKNVIRVYLKSIAPVRVSEKSEIHCWLQVEIFINSSWKTSFLCLPQSHMSIVPVLQVGQVYKIYTNVNLKPFANQEILRVNPNIGSFIIDDSNAIFVIDQEKIRKTCLENSFVSTIEKKFLNQPDSWSRTKLSKKPLLFGIPGDLVPTVLLSDKKKIYLNNWEPKCYPFGVLPQFKLKINSIVKGNGYYKSDAFTNFEIVNYNGNRNLRTINLADPKVNSEIVYGYLGNGFDVPNYVVVRSIVSIKTCKFFRIYFNKNENTVNLKSGLFVKDCKGESFIMCNLISLLEKMLPGVSLQSWYNILRQMGTFSIYLTDNKEIHPSLFPICKYFQEWLTNILNLGIIQLDISCRKLDESNNSYDNNGCPLWYVIEVNEVMI